MYNNKFIFLKLQSYALRSYTDPYRGRNSKSYRLYLVFDFCGINGWIFLVFCVASQNCTVYTSDLKMAVQTVQLNALLPL